MENLEANNLMNRRKHARLDIALSVSYALRTAQGETSEIAEALSSDISASGIRLMTPSPLKPGDILDLEIIIHGEDLPIHASGEVVWQSKISETSYETGAIIRHIADGEKQRFLGFIFDQLARLVGDDSKSESGKTLH